MKQLLPKPSSEADPRLQPSSNTSLTALYYGPRRRASAVKAACSRCRASRSKCDGQRPVCARCATRGYDCVFDVQQGLTRQMDLRLKFDNVKSERDQLQSIIIQMRDGDVREAQGLLRRLRDASDWPLLQTDGFTMRTALASEGSGSIAGDENPLSAASSAPTTDQWSELPFSGFIDGEWVQSSQGEDSDGVDRQQRELSQGSSSTNAFQHPSEGTQSKGYSGRDESRMDRTMLDMPSKAQNFSRQASQERAEQYRQAGDKRVRTLTGSISSSRRKSSWSTYVQEQQMKNLHPAIHLRPPPFVKVNPTSSDVGHIMSYWQIDFVDKARQRISMGDDKQCLMKVLGPAIPDARGFFGPLPNVLLSEAEDVQTWAKLCLQEVQGLGRAEYCASVILNNWIVRWLIFSCEATYDDIPIWLRPTPQEIFTPNLPVYFTVPWVGIRTSLIERPADIVSTLARNLSVNWPHPIRDIFLRDPGTNEQVWNPVFILHIQKLENWSLHTSALHTQPHWATLARFTGEATRYSS